MILGLMAGKGLAAPLSGFRNLLESAREPSGNHYAEGQNAAPPVY